jgi:hypothetical protein
MANRVLIDASLVPLYKKEISDLKVLLSIREDRINNLQIGLAEAEAGKELAHKLAVSEESKRKVAEKKLQAWYRHPALWFSVGLVIAVSAETAIVLSIN